MIIEDRERKITDEIRFRPYGGCYMLLLILSLIVIGIAITIFGPINGKFWLLGIGIPVVVLCFKLLSGLFIIEPNWAVVLVFYGTYKGTWKKRDFIDVILY